MPDKVAEFITQQAVLSQRYGGQGWTQWSMHALAEYEALSADMNAEIERLAQSLWKDKEIALSPFLASFSSAGQQLLNRSLCIAGNKANPRIAVADAIVSDPRLLGEAMMWARDVAALVHGIYSLPDEMRGAIIAMAQARSTPLPQAVNLADPDCLVAAIRALVLMQDAIYGGRCIRVESTSLTLDESRDAVRLALLLKDSDDKLAETLGSYVISSLHDSPALDGFELEVARFSICHVPGAQSPFRAEVRDRMIGIVEDYLVKSRDRKSGRAIGDVRTAADVLLGIGDPVAILKILGWMADYPRAGADLFHEFLNDSGEYEIDPRGRRRDLILGFRVPLVDAPAPTSGDRRSRVEVFRPHSATCSDCGNEMYAIFDVLVEPAHDQGLPHIRRMIVLCCAKCAEEATGSQSRLRLDDRATGDIDKRTCGPDEPASHLARRFVVATDPNCQRAGAWFGGSPRWEQGSSWARCGECHRRMIFLGQVGCTPTYFAFFCPDCHTTVVNTQYD